MRERGKSDKDIARMRVEVRKNVRLRDIRWAADDPNEYSFEVTPRAPRRNAEEERQGEEGEAPPPPPPPPVVHTVYSYFLEHHGIRLRYPKMPLINIGRRGPVQEWFPIEFFTQAFGKTRDATEKLDAALRYNDEHAGTESVEQIESLLGRFGSLASRSGRTQEDLLRPYGMTLQIEAQYFKANVLKEPVLRFENGRASISNGDWRLAENRNALGFPSPADLFSFAIVSMVDERKTSEFFAGLLKRMEEHGIENKTSVALHEHGELSPVLSPVVLDQLVARDSSALTPDMIQEAITHSYSRARNFFLYDSSGYYRDRMIWSRTTYKEKDGRLSEVLVIPPPDPEYGKVAVIRSKDIEPRTHLVDTKEGQDQETRIMVSINIRGHNDLVDPFDFRYAASRGCHQIRNQGEWQNLPFRNADVPVHDMVRHVYQLENGRVLTTDDIIGEPKPFSVVLVEEDSAVVECPSIIFVLKKDDDKANYAAVKAVTNSIIGVPSQCAAASTFRRQKGKAEQYFSNLAIKVNAKLASSLNEARAWNTGYLGQGEVFEEGIPWVAEVPTLVIGVTTSSGVGQNAITMVCGSVGLDTGCMQVAQDARTQARHELIHSSVLKDIIKTLAIHFYNHIRELPQRLLFIRDGLSEGNLDRIFQHEMKYIRSALADFFREQRGGACPDPECIGARGCPRCASTVPITYVLCQSQHNVRVVPADERNAIKNNVFSGTCIGGTQLKMLSGTVAASSSKDQEQEQEQQEEQQAGLDNFILTSHGGLKGNFNFDVPLRYYADLVCSVVNISL
mmetsp:Transcript_2889/g.6223  ORF Transcript_2889/g.6223 Transcript_2889/m.6223 type:complete len:791 (-) Transcript_2889:680-3052(-)